MRKYVKFNEVLMGAIVILLIIVASLTTYILTREERVEVPEIKEFINLVEITNITNIVNEEIINRDGCLYARNPAQIRKCLEKYG